MARPLDVEVGKLHRAEANLAWAKANFELRHNPAWRRHVEKLKEVRLGHLNMLTAGEEINFIEERAFIRALDQVLALEALSEAQLVEQEKLVEDLRKRIRSMQNAGLTATT
jgi:hypothetical protein